MAAPESPIRKASGALAALTAAALALPGLATAQTTSADGDAFTFNYQHYEEGERNLNNQTYGDLNLKPLSVDSLALGLNGGLSDRVKFSLGYTQDTWSGATPVATVPEAAIADQIYSGASKPSSYLADSQGNPVDVNWDTYDGNTVQFSKDPRLVHVMGSASPETRRQGEVKLGYEWDNAAVNLGGGVSVEPDYHSSFVSLDGRLDLNRKLTTLNWSLSYTTSDIHASLEANTAADWGAYVNVIADNNGIQTLYGHRRDRAFSVGVTQVVNKDAVVSASLGYTRGAGYMANPYKAVILAFDDPDQFLDSTGLRTVILKGALEERPNLRNQWTVDLRGVQYIPRLDASLHLDYRFYHDDWGIDAHTLDASWYQPLGGGWMASLGGRYYTQTQASFYRPYFLLNQAMPILGPINPELPRKLDFSQIPLGLYSSDERLSGFGALSGRLALSKQFAQGFKLEVGGEYSAHAGSLKLGGGGEPAYADFRSYSVYSTLTVDLSARALSGAGLHLASPGEGGFAAPAGVRFADLLDRAGEVSIGLRHDYGRRNGGIFSGSQAVDDQSVLDRGCGDVQCQLGPQDSSDHVSTLELMYAPTGWLTLLAAPQLVDRHLDVRLLDGATPPDTGHIGGGPVGQPNYRHTTGGIGDVGLYALVRLLETDTQRLHAGLGLGAPSGNAGVRKSAGQDYASYGLQLGSGVWEFRPSLTWQGQADRWSWGAQLSGVKRLQSRNSAGYAPGDSFQATAWGGYKLFDWLSGSLRATHTIQGSASGAFGTHLAPQIVGYKYVGNELVAVYRDEEQPNAISGPMDMPSSLGGRYWDLGFGLSAMIPNGPMAGNRLSVEWTQPLHDHVNGYQLRRQETLSVSWSLAL